MKNEEHPRLLIASSNPGKIREIKLLLTDVPVYPLGLEDLGSYPVFDEEGETFADVARAKAMLYHGYFGIPTIADDSGLVVDALDGEPGVRSSRYLGEDTPFAEKMSSILNRLAGLPPDQRSARFTCALALAAEGRTIATIIKHVFGRIAEEPRGNGGFGYDPIFYCPELKSTFAEANEEEKNRLSHRGQALRSLASLLETHPRLRPVFGLEP